MWCYHGPVAIACSAVIYVVGVRPKKPNGGCLMRSRTPVFVILFFVLGLGVACSAPDAVLGINIAAPNGDLVTSDTAYRLTGNGNFSAEGNQPDVVVTAVRTFKDGIKGNVVIPKNGIGKAGNIIEIVPPSASYNYWCLASTLDDQPDVTYLIYINDVPNGKDLITFNSGPGATCAASPVPPFDWNQLVKGNFTGTVIVKTR